MLKLSFFKIPFLFFIAFVLALITAKTIARGLGFPFPTVKEMVTIATFIIVIQPYKRLFWFLFFPFFILITLYTPFGLNFGLPTYSNVVAVVSTNILESKEFLQQIPTKHYLYGCSILLSILIIRFIVLRFKLNIIQHKYILIPIGLFLILPQTFISFIDEGRNSIINVTKEVRLLNQLDSFTSEWGNSELNANYDNYVLVIGESARRDYHNAYGYPVENTPFMSSAKGTLIDGFVSARETTVPSLKLMLTKPDENLEAQYPLNLIDLIKSAGIKTYWLSNQGYLGEFDTPISAIAKRSDEKIFLKSANYDSKNSSDFELFNLFNLALSDNQPKRFIVLHLYGSHPKACDRVVDYPKIFSESKIPDKYRELNCYISSIKKTDNLLKMVYDKLFVQYKDTGETFSMIYLSDHGLSSNNQYLLSQKRNADQHLNTPLFKISSDDKERNIYQVFKSGLKLTEGIANWVGIKNNQIDPTVDLFSNQSHPNDELIERVQGRDADPAIDIRFK